MAPLEGTPSEGTLPARSERPCVLVVDDERVNRRILTRMLEKRFLVIEAADGAVAVERVRQGGIDLVVMDINMPVMDGFEATKEIKRITAEGFVPVMLMTASNDEQQLSIGLAAGGDDFLTKPVSQLLLESKIAALLRTKQLLATVTEQRDDLAYFRQRADLDYQVARRVFDGIVARSQLNLPSVDRQLQPMEQFNGDLVMGSLLPGGRFRLMVGDFAGHGLSAAVGALPAADVFHSMNARPFPLASVIRELNTKLNRTLPRTLFLAACVVDLDANLGRISIWNGGLPAALVLDPEGEIIARFESQHLPLGIVPTESIDASSVDFPFPDGARLFLCSDGFLEARRADGEMFGDERLAVALREAIRQGDGWATRVSDALMAWTGATSQSDDITYVGITNSLELREAVIARTTPHSASRAEVSMSFELDADTLREVDPLGPIVLFLDKAPLLRARAGELYIVVCELVSNSIEHGLLHLDSRLKESADGFDEYYRLRAERLANLREGWIRLSLEVSGKGVRAVARIAVEDSGDGFDPAAVRKKTNAISGRGIDLVQALCQSIRYLDGGRIVEAIFPLAE